MRGSKSIIFDVGGVFRDSREAIHTAMKAGFEEEGYNLTLNADEVWRVRGLLSLNGSKPFIHACLADMESCKELPSLPYREAEEKGKRLLQRPVDEGKVKRIRAKYKEVFSSDEVRALIKLHPKAKEVVKALKEEYNLAIVSNASHKSLERDIGDLLQFFNVVIADEDMEKKKPDPEGLLMALEKLNATPQQAIYVGDAISDYIAAKRAGTDFIGIKDGMAGERWLREAGCDKVVGLEGLKDLLGNSS